MEQDYLNYVPWKGVVINMADTKTLRLRIEEQIRTLQEKLRAIDRVEQMAAELGIDRERPSKASETSPTDATFADHSIAEACKLIVFESARDRTAADVLEEVRRRGKAQATREAVSVALRRLARDGLLEARKRPNRKVGIIYRSQIVKQPVPLTERPPLE